MSASLFIAFWARAQRLRDYNYERRQDTLNGMTPMEYRNHAVEEIA